MRSCVRICSGLMLAVAAVAVHPPPAWAQSAPATQPAQTAQSLAEPNTLTLTPFLSTAFGTSQDLGGSLGLGVAVGYDLTRNIGFEGEIGHVFDVLGNDANQDVSITNYSANGVYHFDVSRFTPYATFGLGVEHVGRSVKNPDPLAIYAPSGTEVAYNFGGGVKYPVSERFLARADLRRFQSNDLSPDYWRLYGGLTFWVKRN
jgi:opacity protein-like surface antigen